MKVLYIASNPNPQARLAIEREIMSLQRLAGSGQDVTFIFMPDLAFEEIGHFIQREQPDVVHLSAHGSEEELLFTNSSGENIGLTPEALQVLLTYASPKLVYINACSAHGIAKEIARDGLLAIGTNKPIADFAAIQGAVAFYARLLAGKTVMEAYKASAATVQVLQRGVTTVLYPERRPDLAETRLFRPPRIVAQIVDDKFSPKNGNFSFEIGLVGCSGKTSFVVFASDDEEFIDDDLTNDSCHAVRQTPTATEIWIDHPWRGIYGDFRIHALAINGDGTSYSISSTIVEALTEFYTVYYKGALNFPRSLQKALRQLRHYDGSKLRPRSPDFD